MGYPYSGTVQFSSGETKSYDLVIGADGLHSEVRKLVFGNESLFSHSFGNYFFVFSTVQKQNLGDTEKFYSLINTTINVYAPKHADGAKALFILKDDFDPAINTVFQLQQRFENGGWLLPSLMHDIGHSGDLYADAIQQIRMRSWYKGCVALVGDAAYAPSLATGQGTSMAIAGAYILAREIHASGGKADVAFAAYQAVMKNYVQLNQKMGKNVKNMVAPSRFTLKMQYRFLRFLSRSPFMIRMMKKGMFKAAMR